MTEPPSAPESPELQSSEVEVPAIFLSAYHKVNWAAQHIHHLKYIVSHYIENGVQTRVEQPNGPDGDQIVHIEAGPFGEIVSLLVGDVVRNLRDALDHFMSAAVKYRQVNIDPGRVKFPVAADHKNLVDYIEKTFVSTRIDDIIDKIIYDIKPTKDANSLIWSLNQINNSDKHREITTIISLNIVPVKNFNIPGVMLSEDNVIGLYPGGKFSYIIPNQLYVSEPRFERGMEIKFGPTEVFAGKHVLPNLENCTQAVFQALNKLTECYVKHNKNHEELK